MILTRLKLDPSLRKTMMALSNPNLFHGAIEQSRPGERTRLLWRIDSLNSQPYLLILSAEPLQTEKLEAQFGYPGEKAQVKSYEVLLNHIEINTRWCFRLTANPTFSKLESEGTGRGKVMSHVSAHYQIQWLEKKAAANGFRLDGDSVKIVHTDWKRFRKEKSESPVTLKSVTFEGVLTVTDPELFRKALTEGIGRGKAYGMGLLTIVPYHD